MWRKENQERYITLDIIGFILVVLVYAGMAYFWFNM